MTNSVITSRPPIPDSEFAERGRRLQKAVGESGVDVLLVNSNESDFANVRYLSDYWPVFESAGELHEETLEAIMCVDPDQIDEVMDRHSEYLEQRCEAMFGPARLPAVPQFLFGSVTKEAE